jgi:SAM-dependent methyltransferase
MTIYDALGGDYDRLINWNKRLARDLPLILDFAREAGAGGVLDAACGTGRLSWALAAEGLQVVGLDASEAVLEKARGQSGRGATPRFVAGDLRALDTAGTGFDLVLILGNSPAYLRTEADLQACLDSAARALRPSGRLLAQVVNGARIGQTRRLPGRAEDAPRLDRVQERIDADHYRLRVEAVAGDRAEVLGEDTLRDWRREALDRAASAFSRRTFYGSLARAPWDPQSASDLVLFAQR